MKSDILTEQNFQMTQELTVLGTYETDIIRYFWN